MSTLNQFGDRNRDQQDGFERVVFKKQTFHEAGSYVTVTGTGTEDQEAVVINNGVGMQFADDFNTEVFLVSNGSDTNQKFAMLSIPRDKQRQWAEGTGGIQCPTDPNRALEFNSKRAYIDDANFATRGGVIEVQGSEVFIRGNLRVSGTVGTAQTFDSPNPPNTPPPAAPKGVDVPGFEA